MILAHLYLKVGVNPDLKGDGSTSPEAIGITAGNINFYHLPFCRAPFVRVSSALDSLDGCLTNLGRLHRSSEGLVA